MKKIIMSVMCSLVVATCCANEFVVEPKKKKSSASKLKTQRLDSVSTTLKKLPQVHKLIAEIEECEVNVMCDFFEDAPDSFCATADKKILQMDLDSLQTFNKAVEQFKTALEQRRDFLSAHVE